MPAQRGPHPLVSLDSQLKIPEAVLCKELDGEMVLLNLDSGIYFGLDPAGTRVWEHIQAHGTLRPVLTLLLEEFEVEEARCQVDLFQLVSTLCAHGLLEVVPDTRSNP